MSSKKRKDRSESGHLAEENPFAALASLSGGVSPSPKTVAPTAPSPSPAPASTPWSVARTRKGGWPVSAERRKGGKWVTVIERVSGEAEVLLKELRRRLGSGGALRDGVVEIQGQQVDAVIAYLDETAGR